MLLRQALAEVDAHFARQAVWQGNNQPDMRVEVVTDEDYRLQMLQEHHSRMLVRNHFLMQRENKNWG